MSDTTYRQCTLTKPIMYGSKVTGHATRTAWIPSRYAIIGKVLRIGDEDGWTVMAAAQRKMSQEFVMQRRDDYRYQRRVSDA